MEKYLTQSNTTNYDWWNIKSGIEDFHSYYTI